MSEEESVVENTLDVIVQKYLEIVGAKQRLPTSSDFYDYDISRDKIRSHFGNFTKLHEYMEDNHYEEISEHIFHSGIAFDDALIDGITKNKKQRYVVTTVMDSVPVDPNAYAALSNYCNRMNAKLLLIPCADVWDRAKASKSIKGWNFAPALRGETFVFKDVQLNEKLFISSLRISAKQINPTTGLSRIGQRNCSFVFASPKQFLSFESTSPDDSNMPHAIMTPGTICIPNYNKDRYMSERLSYIAENDHVMGAVIIEVESRNLFHFRQIQFDNKGSFIDLATQYNADGSIKENMECHMIYGDWHSGATNAHVIGATKEMTLFLKVKDVIVHDFFNGKSISHWDEGKPAKKAQKALMNKNKLVDEFRQGGRDMSMILSWISGRIIRSKGNHEEFMDRYLIEGRYVNDPINHFHALDLAKALMSNQDACREGYTLYGELTEKELARIIWLNRDEPHKIAGIECGQHGDLGPAGTRASLASLEKAYGSGVFGHTHSGAILRGIWRVGTCTDKQDYERGPRAKTHTHCVIYDNGQRQLINVINGRWRAEV